MRLAIFVQPCEGKEVLYLAQIKSGIYEGGKAGTPTIFKYGDTPEQAFENLARKLRKRGYEVELWDFERMEPSVRRTRQIPKYQQAS